MLCTCSVVHGNSTEMDTQHIHSHSFLTTVSVYIIIIYYYYCCCYCGAHGSVVVKALCYKPRSRFRDPVRGMIFSICLILLATLGPGVCSAFNRNEYQKHTNNVHGEWSAAGV
jgi:hypothetical protein